MLMTSLRLETERNNGVPTCQGMSGNVCNADDTLMIGNRPSRNYNSNLRILPKTLHTNLKLKATPPTLIINIQLHIQYIQSLPNQFKIGYRINNTERRNLRLSTKPPELTILI